MPTHSLKGMTFRTETGKEFRVLSDLFFPRGKHDRANGKYLDALREGYLVSCSYQNHPVPLVTLKDGVAKLVEIEVAGVHLKGARNISTKLGVAETRKLVVLTKA